MRKFTSILIGLLSLALVLSCTSTTKESSSKTTSSTNYLSKTLQQEQNGFVEFTSTSKVEEIYVQFLSIIQANPGVKIVGSLDHQANATNAGLEMPFSKVTYLYNKHIATQLINENPLAGLDVPTRIAFYQDGEDAQVRLFHESYYISKFNLRESIPNAESASKVFAKVLETFLDEAKVHAKQHKINEGIVEKEFTSDFESVAKKIVTQIAEHPKVDLFFVIDHASLAQENEMKLENSVLLFFGNASTGTQLMLKNPSLGFDLPLKILIFKDKNGKTKVAYNDMKFIFERHEIENEEASAQLNLLLDGLTSFD